MYYQNLLIFICAFFLGITSETPQYYVVTEGEYTLVKHVDGIKVFNKKNPKDGFIEYRAQVEIDAHEIQKVLDFFKDYNEHTHWVYNCTSSILQEIEGQSYLYQICKSPWPYKDRDLHLLTKTRWDGKNKAIVTFESKPEMAPENERFVRIENFNSIWEVEKTEKGILVLVEASFNPKLGAGNLFLKSYSVKIPFETLKNFRKYYR
ncbi:hypothetical protein PP182_04315 [Maribacter sp. PR1]|uniref:START domain-containing protein n=1 Tax=Maribacter cobaltidurans TaxID=1178778 RepID=A0ABU7IQP4_9FLAO|nr:MULTISPECIES: hypothetical protein [Maribacter]MDC6387889.1 hypothetical protein [Maribacter sp. PR1]MEE1975278.1 hypothetical protein [Maribacter cobaltidurans]